MSGLSEKIHELITKLHGGEEVAHHDIEDAVKTVTEHISSTVIPAIEAMVKTAVSEALQFEREEAQRITEELSSLYQKMVDTHGTDAANQAVAEAHATAQTPAETPAV